MLCFSEFKHTTTLLLLELTRTYKDLYHRNKMAFYKKVEKGFNAKGYTLTNGKIRKKLRNMLTTYKRAKDGSRATGEGKITWEYYLVSACSVCKTYFLVGLSEDYQSPICPVLYQYFVQYTIELWSFISA